MPILCSNSANSTDYPPTISLENEDHNNLLLLNELDNLLVPNLVDQTLGDISLENTNDPQEEQNLQQSEEVEQQRVQQPHFGLRINKNIAFDPASANIAASDSCHSLSTEGKKISK